MAKASKKTINIKSNKTSEQGSALFHNIMAASVKGNPKPKKKADKVNINKPTLIIELIQDELAKAVPDYGNYVVLTIALGTPHQLFYNISDSCPKEKLQKIEKIIKENAAHFNLAVNIDDID